MASQFGPERLEYSTGGPIADQPIYVRLRGSLELAQLFADVGETASAANPVLTDSSGDLVFYAASGYYDLAFGGHVKPIVVGAPGGAPETKAYTHVQTIAATPWLIDHGLPFRPAGVRVIESTGDPLEAAIDYVGDQVRITFSAPTSGVAYLS